MAYTKPTFGDDGRFYFAFGLLTWLTNGLLPFSCFPRVGHVLKILLPPFAFRGVM